MTTIYSNLNDIADPFQGILLDAYGVFWGGNDYGLLPGCKESMHSLMQKEKIVGILSNSTQLAEKEMRKLEAHGLKQGVHYHFLITSGELARHIFLNNTLPFKTLSRKYWLHGSVHPRFSSHQSIFQDSGYAETQNINEAEFIYVMIPHIDGEDQTQIDLFRSEVEKLIKFKLPMICPNPDKFAHEGNPPRPVVRQGSIAAIYEELGGQVFYIGKPSSVAFNKSMEAFHKYGIENASQVLMIGDTPETDIKGAKEFGMSAALLTKTGIMAERINEKGFVAAVQKLLRNEYPDFFIERMA